MSPPSAAQSASGNASDCTSCEREAVAPAPVRSSPSWWTSSVCGSMTTRKGSRERHASGGARQWTLACAAAVPCVPTITPSCRSPALGGGWTASISVSERRLRKGVP
eukprot:5686254-Prymnesium_polylepis.1